jgi:hypothetical protein
MLSSLERSAALLNRDRSTSLDPTSFIFNMQVIPARYTVTGGITVVQPGRTGEVHESEETQDFVAEYPSERFPSCEFQGYFGGRILLRTAQAPVGGLENLEILLICRLEEADMI